MGLRGVTNSTSNDSYQRLASTVKELQEEVLRLRSVVRRDTLKANGYDLEYRTTPSAGLYIVNRRDGDPNNGTATLIGV